MLIALPLCAQSNAGELRLKVVDPHGLGVKASITLSSEVAQLHRSLVTDDAGSITVRNLPFGPYRLRVECAGFSAFIGILEIRSALPTEYLVKLSIAAISTAVDVTAESPLLDPNRTPPTIESNRRLSVDRSPHFRGDRCRIWWTPNRAGSTKAAPACTRAARNIRRSSLSTACR